MASLYHSPPADQPEMAIVLVQNLHLMPTVLKLGSVKLQVKAICSVSSVRMAVADDELRRANEYEAAAVRDGVSGSLMALAF